MLHSFSFPIGILLFFFTFISTLVLEVMVFTREGMVSFESWCSEENKSYQFYVRGDQHFNPMDYKVKKRDQYQYLGNCPPTPPLTQQQSINNKLGLLLGSGSGRWAVAQILILIQERFSAHKTTHFFPFLLLGKYQYHAPAFQCCVQEILKMGCGPVTFAMVLLLRRLLPSSLTALMTPTLQYYWWSVLITCTLKITSLQHNTSF